VHHDEQALIVVNYIVYRHDAGVVQPGNGSSLAPETFYPLAIG
jgi:hypothetical protein